MKVPKIQTKQCKFLYVSVSFVFRASFNDTFLLDTFTLPIETLSKDAPVWFDPFFGKGKVAVEVALTEATDTQFTLLIKKNGQITERRGTRLCECIVCEDYDDSRLIAAHIHLKE